MRKSLFVLFALVAAVVAVGASSAGAARPLQVDFVKQATGACVFAGTVTGDVTGDLISTAVGFEPGPGGIIHVTFEWKVTAGSKSFVALTSGIWNTHTGAVVMNGRVTSGYLNGAQVHEEGHLVDPATFTFAGFLRLLPRTAA